MGLNLQDDPDKEPVSLEEAKGHLRVHHGNDDVMIKDQIVAARELIEDLTSRAIITQTWQWFRDDFPEDVFDVPKPPLQSVDHIKYTDQDGTTTTVSASKYIVDTDNVPARIALKTDENWPNVSAGLQRINAVEIQFIAGYGDKPDDVPAKVKKAMKLIIGHLYENRQWVVTNEFPSEIMNSVKSLIASEKARLRSGITGSTIRKA